MSEIIWIQTKSVIVSDQVDTDLRSVVSRRFDKAIRVDRLSPIRWLVHYPPRPVYSLELCLWRSGQRLAINPSHIPPEWPQWFGKVVHTELAVLYSAECGSDTADDTWSPEPNKLPTFENYLKHVLKYGEDQCQAVLVQQTPKPLR